MIFLAPNQATCQLAQREKILVEAQGVEPSYDEILARDPRSPLLPPKSALLRTLESNQAHS